MEPIGVLSAGLVRRRQAEVHVYEFHYRMTVGTEIALWPYYWFVV
jgi:hypothetical protein